MGYSNGKPSPNGRFTTDGESDARRHEEMSIQDELDRVDPKAAEIRHAYDCLVKAARASSSIVGPDVEHTRDIEAFEQCQKLYGYVVTVRALLKVSARAKELNDAYWKKRNR